MLNDEINRKVVNMESEMLFEVQHFTSKKEIPKSPNPLKLSKWVKEEILDATERIDNIEKKHNCFPVCGKGCASCCYQAIMIKEIEFRAMIPILEHLSIEQRKQIAQRATEQEAILKQNGITDTLIAINWKVTGDGNEHEKYFSLHLPCPLLSDKNECMVYPVRPSNCWTYRNYGDPKECEERHNAPHAIAHRPWESVFLDRIGLAYKNYSKQTPKLLQTLLVDYFNEL